jgi:hypothetical protein
MRVGYAVVAVAACWTMACSAFLVAWSGPGLAAISCPVVLADACAVVLDRVVRTVDAVVFGRAMAVFTLLIACPFEIIAVDSTPVLIANTNVSGVEVGMLNAHIALGLHRPTAGIALWSAIAVVNFTVFADPTLITHARVVLVFVRVNHAFDTAGVLWAFAAYAPRAAYP